MTTPRAASAKPANATIPTGAPPVAGSCVELAPLVVVAEAVPVVLAPLTAEVLVALTAGVAAVVAAADGVAAVVAVADGVADVVAAADGVAAVVAAADGVAAVVAAADGVVDGVNEVDTVAVGVGVWAKAMLAVRAAITAVAAKAELMWATLPARCIRRPPDLASVPGNERLRVSRGPGRRGTNATFRGPEACGAEPTCCDG
jgi:hypothetical protein